MKKIRSILLAFALVAVLCACGGGAPAVNAASSLNVKTMGDVLRLDTDSEITSWGNYRYFCAFIMGDSAYRAWAKMDPVSEQLIDALDYNDADYDQKLLEIADGLELEMVEDLSGQYLSGTELDELVGKTGKELAKSGWICIGSMPDDGGAAVYAAQYGPFVYNLVFDGEADSDSRLPNLPVKSAVFGSMSDAIMDGVI